MYLNRLNNEQKELFLDLCIHASKANNDFADDEKEFIKLYANEMQLCDVRYEAKNKFEEAMAKLVSISSSIELKIVVFELTALILSDHQYDELESTFMSKVIRIAGIDTCKHKEMIEMLNEISMVYEKLNSIILE